MTAEHKFAGRTEVEVSLHDIAEALVLMAQRLGYDLTVTQKPKTPLAMGKFDPIITTSPRRGTY